MLQTFYDGRRSSGPTPCMKQMQQELKFVRQGQEETALRLARSTTRKDTYVFKRRGNELQYHFNEQLVDRVEAAKACLEKMEVPASSHLEELRQRATNEVTEGTELLTHRQKIIKFADRSELGWAVVDEYEDDDLAEDSDDEKRMEKAERQAERKLAKRRKIREAKGKDDLLAKPVVIAVGTVPMKAAVLRPPPQFPLDHASSAVTRVTGEKNALRPVYPFHMCEHVVEGLGEGEVVLHGCGKNF